MTNEQHDQATKAEVQSTKLNQMPVPGENNAEFASEFTAEAENANQVNENQVNANQTNAQQANHLQSQQQQ